MSLPSDVLFSTITGSAGDVGLITLNRPQALNALTYQMCITMNEQLALWEQDNCIKAVIIRGAGEKAFCAGGDIRKIYDLGKSQAINEAMHFFKEEYQLNYRIHHFPKPYIALLDGIAMGGGLGVSLHGTHRVATEKLTLAMPETSIGFFPDIGGSFFLSRTPKFLGIYLGLTGAHIKAADALYARLVDNFILSQDIDDLIKEIVQADFADEPRNAVEKCIARFAQPTEASTFSINADKCQVCFSQPALEAIQQALQQGEGDWYRQTETALQGKSPTSLKVTLSQLQKAQHLDMGECLQMEYQMVYHFLQGHDFYEGIRAMLIDKDRKPAWQPNYLKDISQSVVEAYFVHETTAPTLTF